MKRFTVRYDVAYRIDVDASNEADAILIASMIPEEDWNQVSSGYEAAEAGS